MTAPQQTPGVPPQATAWRRLHPLTPLLNGGFIFVVLAGIFVSNFRDSLFGPLVRNLFGANIGSGGAVDYDRYSGNSDPANWFFNTFAQGGNTAFRIFIPIIVLFGSVLLGVLFSWVSWRYMRFQITAEAVELQRGVLFKKQSRAPLKRVQAIDIERRLLARIFGLAELNILNAGDTLKLAFLKYSDAKALRDEILQSVKIAKGGDSVTGVPGSEAYGAAQHTAAAGGQVVGGQQAWQQPVNAPSMLEQRAEDFLDEDIDRRALAAQTLFRVQPGKLLLSRIFDTGTLVVVAILVCSISAVILVPEPEVKLMVSVALLPAFFGVIASVWGGFNKYFGFTVSTVGDEVRIAAGLTKTKTETLHVRRIQSVQVSQSLMWRLFGWWRVEYTIPVAATSGQEAQQVSKVALPVGSREEVQQLLAIMLPDMITAETVREGMDGTGDWQISPPPRGVLLNLFNQNRKAALLRTDGASRIPLLLLRSGSVVRWFTILPVTRVQGVIYSVNLKHAILRLARLNVFSSRVSTKSKISGLDPAELQRFTDSLATVLLAAQLAEAADIHRSRHATPADTPAPPLINGSAE